MSPTPPGPAYIREGNKGCLKSELREIKRFFFASTIPRGPFDNSAKTGRHLEDSLKLQTTVLARCDGRFKAVGSNHSGVDLLVLYYA